MIHDPKDNEWQWKAADGSGLYLPWFTRPFLDCLEQKKIPLLGKRVLEWGTGWGTLWLASQVVDRSNNRGYVLSIDHDRAWTDLVRQKVAPCHREHIELKTCDVAEDYITYAAEWLLKKAGFFDIIIVDGELRSSCAVMALQLIRPAGGIIVLDNADEYPQIVEMFSREEHHCYSQPGHPHWRTDYWVWRNVPPAPANTTEASALQKRRRGM